MNKVKFTINQKKRLIELGADRGSLERVFESEIERDNEFNKISCNLIENNLKNLETFLRKKRKPLIRELEENLRSTAISLGFSEVITPTIIPKAFIEAMGIKSDHPLWNQIIWVDEKRALRPFLAPNLYVIMKRLIGIVRPVRIFEIGSCFRRDTKGPYHLEEFTMLNLVEFAPRVKNYKKRLIKYIDTIMNAANLKEYEILSTSSEVYGETIDVIVNGVEVASAAIGPKPIDVNWGVQEPWIGVGFGLERMAMLVGNYNSVARVAKSLSYINGSRIDVIRTTNIILEEGGERVGKNSARL